LKARARVRFVVAVHGGCGPSWKAADRPGALKGVKAAVAAARDVLASGGSALDAACAAVVVLEDDPHFNAGTGAVLNRDGVAELDASVMSSDGACCGGVAALVRVRNPVLVARRVMEDTPHVLLAGQGALQFARQCGFEDYDPVTPAQRRRHGSSAGTVGAVVRDSNGVFAAATSTGGVSGKLPGRVGDTPIIGAGNFAGAAGASSATGNGELMMRILATKTVCDLIAAGKTASASVRKVVAGIHLEPRQSAALIAVDAASRVGFAMNGGRMPLAWFREGDEDIVAEM
jgi:beta-aspartyl-peptidase (threonine type)